MLELEYLERLRLENKNLLERLKVKQKEFWKMDPEKRVHSQERLSHIAPKAQEEAKTRSATDDETRRSGSGEGDREDSVRLFVEDTVTVAASPRTTTVTPLREASHTGEVPRVQSNGPFVHGDTPAKRPYELGESFLSQQKITRGESTATDSDKCHSLVSFPATRGSQDRQEMIQGPGGSVYYSKFQKSLFQSGCERSTLELAKYADRLLIEGNKQSMKEVKKPKSILVTPQNKDTKEAGFMTHLSSPRESPFPAGSWSVCPLLGYDWIAGLLDMDPSLWEKSEQYFSELYEFRQVNREECSPECHLESDILDFSTTEQDKVISLDSHPCIYCYRVNKRLFLNPLGSELCPVCKTARNQETKTVEERAYVRVSFPRSILLPLYTSKVHRWKSFDPTDSLALISHCSAGWESSMLSSDIKPSSLDLKTLLEPRAAVRDLPKHSHLELLPRIASSSRSDHLMGLSSSAYFQLQKADWS
ncbi:migration and invasion-inhibitory protein [Rhinatrema bivittatum]|uniref:migration and invasion-inhibitory protein n=1 Tax=Rhinatrema bivittatum TaxID=194408 RepID=UPI00112CB4ED|nr:migration and invasion-inhibitory protein [Rhinatrema bivittatum]XP_029426879.1 migration and invasion-inhibitory protein [Rhinatrema bivittatum]XP_029426880.1 migration and invasion-inhibitory protein [Rhinatrema bivittatum]XP_029426881.1 migration and invasion-inhibitory protein [Rhinatrema bivittatum]XP_029426882.1 migration and invasion-inhibitory protein [Rhinatrema bivittatum]